MDATREIIIEKRKTDATLAKIASKFEAENPDHWDLDMYLILPIQRLPRYELMLSAILKFTPPGHADYENLRQGRLLIKEINDWINARKGESDSHRKIQKVVHPLV